MEPVDHHFIQSEWHFVEDSKKKGSFRIFNQARPTQHAMGVWKDMNGEWK